MTGTGEARASDDPAETLADALVDRAESGAELDLDAELASLPAAMQQRVRAVLAKTKAVYSKLDMSFPLLMTEARRIAGYRLGRLIGEGGMAKVQVAIEEVTGRKVALKLLVKTAATAHVSARFRDEQRWAVLEHPGIVRVYGAGETQDVLFLAMELVAGPSLAQVIAALADYDHDAIFRLPGLERTLERLGLRDGDDAPATPAARRTRGKHVHWCCEITAEVAAALAYAHDADILHRDVKPSNILLHPDGHPRLADFGLARKQSEPSVTRSFERPGTAVYMSPQQLDPAAGAVDWRADVYALGVTLYELLTLERPFRSKSESVLIREVCTRRPTSPERLNTAIPRDLAAIVMRALEKDPAHRYASARELHDDLVAFVAGKTVKAHPTGMATRVVRRLRRDRPLRRIVAAGAAIVVVAAGLIGARMVADARAFERIEKAVHQAVAGVNDSIARGEHPAAKSQAKLADQLADQAQLGVAGRPWSVLQEARLEVALRVNDFAAAQKLLEESETHATSLPPSLLLACARAALLVDDDPARGLRCARDAVNLARDQGDNATSRAAALIVAILEALGAPRSIPVAGVFDPSALAGSPAGDLILVGPKGEDTKPHVYLRRGGDSWADAQYLGALVDRTLAPSSYGNVTVAQTSTKEALHAVIGVDDRVVAVRIPRDRPTEFDAGRPLDLYPAEPGAVQAKVLIARTHDDGAPASVWWLVRNKEGANISYELEVDRARGISIGRRLTDARVNGSARLSAGNGRPETFVLGLGEWGDGFGAQAQQMRPASPETMVRCGHVTSLCGADERCFVLGKSTLNQNSVYLGHSRPLGWDRGVYLCRLTQGGASWNPVLADLSFDPVEAHADIPAVAFFQCAGSKLCVAVCNGDIAARGGTELRFYEVPAQLPEAGVLQSWEPVLRLWRSGSGVARPLWVANVEGNGDAEVCQWTHGEKDVAISLGLSDGRKRKRPAVVGRPPLPDHRVPAPASTPVGGTCVVSVDPRVEVATDGTLRLDGVNFMLPQAGAYFTHGGASFTVEIEVTPRRLDYATSLRVGLRFRMRDGAWFEAGAKFEVSGGEGDMRAGIELHTTPDAGQTPFPFSQRIEVAAQPFIIDARHRVTFAYDASARKLAVNVRDPLRPNKLLLDAAVDGAPLAPGLVFVGILAAPTCDHPFARVRANVGICLPRDPQNDLRPQALTDLAPEQRVAWGLEAGHLGDPFDVCLCAEHDRSLSWSAIEDAYAQARATLERLDPRSVPAIDGRRLATLLLRGDRAALREQAVAARVKLMRNVNSFEVQEYLAWYYDLLAHLEAEDRAVVERLAASAFGAAADASFANPGARSGRPAGMDPADENALRKHFAQRLQVLGLDAGTR